MSEKKFTLPDPYTCPHEMLRVPWVNPKDRPRLSDGPPDPVGPPIHYTFFVKRRVISTDGHVSVVWMPACEV